MENAFVLETFPGCGGVARGVVVMYVSPGVTLGNSRPCNTQSYCPRVMSGNSRPCNTQSYCPRVASGNSRLQ